MLGVLSSIENGFINEGGEIEKRKAFVELDNPTPAETDSLPPNTFGLQPIPAGLLVLVVAPRGVTDSWPVTLVHAALFGLVAYATYDLTNLATLKGWPVGLAMLDMAWGCVASCAATAAGKLAFQRFA